MANNQNTQNAQQTNNQQANNKTAAMAVKRETIDIVAAKVREFQNKGELFFPPNYIPENALKSAWLMLQETVDKENKPALEVCSKESIANALLSMVIQGLNPDKDQCYFIARGKKLCLQRSYFGSMHVAKSVDESIEDIIAEVVYNGDDFEFEKVRGKTQITKHKQKLENIKKDKIIAAYATVLYKDGKEESIVMTIDEIKEAWKQSPIHPVDEKGNIKTGTTHDRFTAEMCKKTVINRICKPIINSSDDSNIVARYAKQTDTDMVEAEVEEEINQNANKEIIDIEADYTVTEAEPQEAEPPKEEKKTASKESQQSMFNEGPGY